jgi:hypothetical protein
MQRSRRRWGRFDVTIAGRSGTLRVVAAAMNARSRATGIATGDQAMFVERALFESVGGFREQPLMEDIDLSKRLKRAAGAPLCLRERVSTSGRRWESRGCVADNRRDVALALRLLARRRPEAARRSILDRARAQRESSCRFSPSVRSPAR